MKLKLFVVLAACCLAFAGKLPATPSFSAPQISQSNNIDPALLERIIIEVAAQSDLTCCEAKDAYYKGEMEISKTVDGYSVRVADADGGISDILIIETAL